MPLVKISLKTQVFGQKENPSSFCSTQNLYLRAVVPGR